MSNTYLCAISLDEKNWVIYQEWGTKIPSKKNKSENAFSARQVLVSPVPFLKKHFN